MTPAIGAIGTQLSIPEIRLPENPGKPREFQAALEGAIGRVEESRGAAHQAVERFLNGEPEELHTAALAVQRAELAMEMFLQVRNKVVQAYQEIMRMQM